MKALCEFLMEAKRKFVNSAEMPGPVASPEANIREKSGFFGQTTDSQHTSKNMAA